MRTEFVAHYLTKSRVRADLLTLFFLNPTATYYVRELARRLETSVGAVARELQRFAQEGLLVREARGREIFYRVNQAHPLFTEIKGIVEKTRGIPVRLAEGLRPMAAIRQAFLYGSFATGTLTAQSDLDLLLVGQETSTVRTLLKQLEARFGRTINVTVFAPAEFARKRQDRSSFLYDVLRGPLIPLKPSRDAHGSHPASPSGSTGCAASSTVAV